MFEITVNMNLFPKKSIPRVEIKLNERGQKKVKIENKKNY